MRGPATKGLSLYCQPSNGFKQGREGVEYLAVCTPRLELEFLPAYKEGRLIGDHERELTALLGIKRPLEAEIKNIDRRTDNKFFADLSRGERTVSVDLILLSESLEKEKRELKEKIQWVTREIDDLSIRIESMMANTTFGK